MINHLQINNFKCFQQSKTFEFSKLNLLTGINGRGKSSLLQSILLIAQSVDIYKLTEKLSLNGHYIDLGNFDDVRNSDTVRSEDIIFNLKMANTINAILKFKENENDHLTAVTSSINITIDKIEEYEKVNSAVDEFVKNLLSQFGDSDTTKIPIDTNQIVFNNFISKIHYISADRIGPVKYVDKTSLGDSEFITVGSNGEHAINVLAKSNLPLVNDKLYLGNDAKSVIQQTEEWLAYILEGAKIEIKGREKESSVLWMLINNKSNSYKYKPTNVGFGYSYVLPLIVSGLIAQPGEILIIENPEAHLHPRAQSRIAEFFAKVASCDVQVFIESHSEHILNGLRVGVLNPDINIENEELVIHYFNESFESEKLIVDNKGKIANWPNGFFDQQEIDLASIFKFTR